MKPLGTKRIRESEKRRSVKRGAVRSRVTPAKPSRRLPLVRMFLGVVAVVAGAALVTLVDWRYGYERVRQIASRPITQVEIQGTFQFLDESAIHARIEQQREDGFVRANLREMKKQIEGVPWVESVSVNRVWPDGMQIKIREQKPIARWGDKGFINQYGDIVKADQVDELKQLPVLFGEEKQSEEITRTYLEVAELLAAKGLSLRGLYLDEKRAWTLQFNNDIEIVMGREDVIQKLRNFLYVYEKKLQQHENEIARIDLRYRSGLAVRWKAKEEQLADSEINKLLVKVN